MAAHGAFQFRAGGATRQWQTRIERVEVEKIPMLSGRRLRTAVASFTVVVYSGFHDDGRNLLMQVCGFRRNVEKKPMSESSVWRVRIIHDQDKAFGFGGRINDS